MTTTAAAPKCPSCGAQGLETMVARPTTTPMAAGGSRSPVGAVAFVVISCGACGHVYGVLSAPTAADDLSGPNPPRPA
ncbi:MAG TPA: hypothetical protein VFL91_33230 [Thermomicrobiales bacterium]|nr:hypothetical protein [Thermomicrobiales bacterium]